MLTKAFFYLSLLFSLFFSFHNNAQVPRKNLNDVINSEIRPYLDSLRITTPVKDNHQTSSFILESVFPATDAPYMEFSNFSVEGTLSSFTPENEKLNGLISEPIELFQDNRIGFAYSIRDSDYQNLLFNTQYKFTSIAETSSTGEKMIRQRLYLTLRKGRLFSDIQVGMIDLQIYKRHIDVPIEIKRPVYRFISFSREKDQFSYNYLMKDKDGIYNAVYFKDGSDRTFAEFQGGRNGMFVFFLKNMKYPNAALIRKEEATVLVSVTINKKGKVSKAKILYGSNPLFNKEALRLARKTSGKWTPATHNGKNIVDERTVPVSFKLEYAQ